MRNVKTVTRAPRPSLVELETRFNPGIVTALGDYWLNGPPQNPASKAIPGTLRFEIVNALATGEPVTFNTNPANGVDFDDPANPQTINLGYGEISINKSVSILAPRFQSQNDELPLVTINRSKSLGDDDRSVFDITIVENNNEPPTYSQTIHFAGLQISGGTAEAGGGINALGTMNIIIDKSQISNNSQSGPGGLPSTAGSYGGGIAAIGMPFINHGSTLPLEYGPRVTIRNSVITSNQTSKAENADDKGGGIYLTMGASLDISDSTISANTAEDAGGGIYFGGGASFEDPVNGGYKLFTSYLKISRCEISGNSATADKTEATGGGLVIAGPTMGLIFESTFSGNTANTSGGAVTLTGFGSKSIEEKIPEVGTILIPYTEFIGAVYFVRSTVNGNTAAAAPNYGVGGAVFMKGIANEAYFVNATISGNKTNGTGGGLFLQPSENRHSYRMKFDVDYDQGLITPSAGQDLKSPPTIPILTFQTQVQIHNTTITDNWATGTKGKDGFGNDVIYGSRGGGVAIAFDPTFDPPGAVSFISSIIAANHVPDEFGMGDDIWVADDDGVSGNSKALGGQYNLVSVADSGEFALSAIVADPQLHPLADNGGPTKTHQLKPYSPALDVGWGDVVINSTTVTLNTDQRGKLREYDFLNLQLTNPPVDIGSYELQVRYATVTSVKANDQKNNQHSMIISFTITFSEAVAIAGSPANAFTLEHLDYNAPNNTVALNATHNGAVVVLTFAAGGAVPIDPGASLIDGVYKLTIDADKVSTFQGKLDGNYDGIGGDDYIITGKQDNDLFRLFGDGDGNGEVNAADYSLFRQAYGSKAGESNWNFAFDYNNDGMITSADYNEFRLRYGVELTFP